VANVARSEYLFVQTRNYAAGDAGVLGATITGPPPPPPPPPATLQTAREADFNGDLRADLLWRYTDGRVALWKMNGLTAVEYAWIGSDPVDPAWRIVGTGDLNGDGAPDIIWQHASGAPSAWLMNRGTPQQWAYLNPRLIDPAWKIVAVADVNGDSRADLIWQHDRGWLVVWYMNGFDMISSEYLTPNGSGDSGWRIVGAGDLNGDTMPDLVWRHQSSGELAAWFMSGKTAIATSFLSPSAVGFDWTVGAVVDLNGDGRSDLVWQHSSGAIAAWLMNGATVGAMPWLSPGTVLSGWQLAAPK
jgi:ketosteroid isomerase-like protein